MAGLRQDYLMTQIELLRQFVARLLRKQDKDGLDEALQLALHLQEKLFPTTPAEFLRLEINEQIAALRVRESKADGQAKCLAYAQLLKETATLYQIRGREDLAAGARQLALHVALSIALDQPASPASIHALIGELQDAVEIENLHPPVQALLTAYRQL